MQRALADENYETPTPIQAQTIPAALDGRDVLGSAQTGTGKTAAFSLPILHRLAQRPRKARPNRPQVLILAPTRELAIQIEQSIATYGRHLKVRRTSVFGGVSQVRQVRTLNRGVHILVATPGRLLDLMNQGHIHLDDLDVFVLDEADRMLDMGFLPDLRRIISKLPDERQSLFFSATLPPKIVELTDTLLTDPVTVNVAPKARSVDQIEQKILHVDRSRKQAILQKILGETGVERAIVFTKTKRGANMVAEKLMRSGVRATAIHGNKSQSARQRALEAFRKRRVQVLVATDVAARGIDIDGISHVVNYDMPIEPEAYVHRIGRTGRAGAEGIALSFCTSGERRELRAIEQLIGHRVPVCPDHPQSAAGDERPSSRSRPRRGSSMPRPSGGQRRPRHDSGGPVEPSGEESKSKRRRRPRRRGQRRSEGAGQAR
ncbi:DEAD/DEAH box helicase [Maioricimonas rarisocia]|uniref:DEAD/DEAH box helicase n=1 Tax=Maioricimonas rarisocia TaxID=2528026 RepID=UPI001E4F7570|nr:DEAD/DEAH box helicase [Maioricimonas rarisocia]